MNRENLKKSLLDIIIEAKALPEQELDHIPNSKVWVKRGRAAEFRFLAASYIELVRGERLTFKAFSSLEYIDEVYDMLSHEDVVDYSKLYQNMVDMIEARIREILADNKRAKSVTSDGKKILAKYVSEYENLLTTLKMLQTAKQNSTENVELYDAEVKEDDAIRNLLVDALKNNDSDRFVRVIGENYKEHLKRINLEKDALEAVKKHLPGLQVVKNFYFSARDEEAALLKEKMEKLKAEEQARADEKAKEEAMKQKEAERRTNNLLKHNVDTPEIINMGGEILVEDERLVARRARNARRHTVITPEVIVMGGEVKDVASERINRNKERHNIETPDVISLSGETLENDNEASIYASQVVSDANVDIENNIEIPKDVSIDALLLQARAMVEEAKKGIMDENKPMINKLKKKVASLIVDNIDGSFDKAIALFERLIEILKEARSNDKLIQLDDGSFIKRDSIREYNDILKGLVEESKKSQEAVKTNDEEKVQDEVDSDKSQNNDKDDDNTRSGGHEKKPKRLKEKKRRFFGKSKSKFDTSGVEKKRYSIKDSLVEKITKLRSSSNRSFRLSKSVVALCLVAVLAVGYAVDSIISLIKNMHNDTKPGTISVDPSNVNVKTNTSSFVGKRLNNAIANQMVPDYIDLDGKNLTDSIEEVEKNIQDAYEGKRFSGVIVDSEGVKVTDAEQTVDVLLPENSVEVPEVVSEEKPEKVETPEDTQTLSVTEEAPTLSEISTVYSSAPGVIPIDFSGYYKFEGSDEQLMQVFGFSDTGWYDFCSIMLAEGAVEGYVEGFATVTTALNRLVYEDGYGTNLYDIATAWNQYVVYQEGTYLDYYNIYDSTYADGMAAIRDALYNFALDQSKRVHNELEFRADGTGKYSKKFTIHGNEFGVTLKDSRVSYVDLDTSVLQTNNMGR